MVGRVELDGFKKLLTQTQPNPRRKIKLQPNIAYKNQPKVSG